MWCHPRECCGLLATDREGRLRMVYSLTNAADSSVRFTIEPREHFGALMHAESRGWEIAGVFHSHPGGDALLSPTDLSQPHEPEWLHVIVGLRPDTHLRAWRIEGGRAVEVRLI